MRKLLFVSNRLPVTVEKKKDTLKFNNSVGGLATGLGSFYKSYESAWVGWCGISMDNKNGKLKSKIERKLNTDFNNYPVSLSKKDVEQYYYGFSNKTIWPLFHSFTQYAIYEKDLWESYQHVNKLFYDKVIKVAEPDDIIWIHDYHLMLLPSLIREKFPDITVGFFLHIPFPSFEIFRLLPWRREILEGLLGADLLGFHIYDYARHFLSSIRHLLGYEHTFGQITAGNRIVKADAFPMGIDYERFSCAVGKPAVQKEIDKIRKNTGPRKIILSIDRLDYTKGILQRLEAFDSFLANNPEYKENVTFFLVVTPSRTEVEHYKLLKKQVDELISNINGKHGSISWMPIRYLYNSLPFYNLVALYNIASVALVTPLRDGMNLIAKEFIAAKTDGKGVLILSEMAGAAKELGEAIIVNPNNKEDIENALKEALIMPDKEQVNRNRLMQKRLKRYNVRQWADDFIGSLSKTKRIQQELCARKITYQIREKLISDYVKSNNRIILLDYDGTLVPFAETPQKAKPNQKLLKLLKILALNSKNELVITSGRDKKTIEKWFGKLECGLIAEHGAWIKPKGEDWGTIEPLKNDWKQQIRPVLEPYVDRTPGSFIEEKDFSLAWHYRKVDSELGLVRGMELKSTLMNLTANFNLGVLEGNKVIEIKSIGINKGQAALKWILKKDWNFILAIGDDWTDEDTFLVLPKSAYSIKVGLGPSEAKFNLSSVNDVLLLLKEMAG